MYLHCIYAWIPRLSTAFSENMPKMFIPVERKREKHQKCQEKWPMARQSGYDHGEAEAEEEKEKEG